ncbi:hypothetical protein HAX54_021039 [Datura stramonium]|uniref:Uncharacterized protein n=1 Tax=Datura stramonium TaxID=4076 RepID=A0ABS8US70_DATST|nr:hypothetical protein [Datura stramonium]
MGESEGFVAASFGREGSETRVKGGVRVFAVFRRIWEETEGYGYWRREVSGRDSEGRNEGRWRLVLGMRGGDGVLGIFRPTMAGINEREESRGGGTRPSRR